jgi:hypothetical protein
VAFAPVRAGVSAAIAFLWFASSCLAARPAEAIVPASTKAFVVTANLSQLLANWDKTEFGHLYQDSAMKPFREDVERQLTAKGLDLQQRIGLSLQELDGLATGEVAAAIIPTPQGHGTLALLADVSGHVPQTRARLDKMGATFARRGGTRGEQVVAGVNLTMFNLPAEGKNKMPQVAYCLRENLLIVADNIGTAATLLRRLAEPAQGGLDTLEAYRAIVARVAKGNPFKSDLAWYIDPIGLLEVLEVVSPHPADAGPDPLKIAKSEGFSAIRGAGGVLSLAIGPYGALHRTSIYAPPPYERAMRMAAFKNGQNFTPQNWVPAKLATYTSFNWDIMTAFDSFGSLFDAMFGEGEQGVWDDVIESLRDDPNGPQIDLRNDLVAHLGGRATILTDVETPITPHSQRRIFAAEVKDPAALAVAIEKSMRNDPGVKQRKFKEYKIFEILPEDEDADAASEGNKRPLGRAGGAGGGRLMPNSAVTVAHGTLFVSTHVSFLEKILAPPTDTLANAKSYREVADHLQKLGGAQACMQGYSDNAEKWLLAYELFRAGKLPESDLTVATLLNRLFITDTAEDEIRKQQIDGSKLPDYSVVRHYLGTGGVFANTEADGWFVIGFSLRKSQLQRPAAAQAAATEE